MADEAAVLSYVKSMFKHHQKCIALRVTSTTGMPDIIACVNGRFVGIEVKDDVDGPYTVTKAQRMRLKAIIDAGGVGCVVDKNNVNEFETLVNNIVEKPSMAVGAWGYTL